MAGMSLSDYLLGELREIAERPTLAEFRERLHKRKPLPVALDTGGLLREERHHHNQEPCRETCRHDRHLHRL